MFLLHSMIKFLPESDRTCQVVLGYSMVIGLTKKGVFLCYSMAYRTHLKVAETCLVFLGYSMVIELTKKGVFVWYSMAYRTHLRLKVTETCLLYDTLWPIELTCKLETCLVFAWYSMVLEISKKWLKPIRVCIICTPW